MKTLLLIILIASTAALTGCSQVTEADNKKADPRNLSWSVDTVYFPNSYQTLMGKAWADSKNDMYVIGHSDESRGKMHYNNGSGWLPIPLGHTYGGPIPGPHSLRDIIGFSADNVYIAGSADYLQPDYSRITKSLIVHFNGSSWEVENIEPKGSLFCIWGDAPDNIWAAGNSNSIYHYNGTEWRSDSLNHPGYPALEVSLAGHSITGNQAGGYYMLTYSIFPGGIYFQHILTLQNNSWVAIDSLWNLDMYELWMSPTGTLYITRDDGVYIYNGGSWTRISGYMQAFGIAGTSDENIFITARVDNHSKWFHYNGTDWAELDVGDIPNLGSYDIKVFDDKLISVGYDLDRVPTRSYILLGE